eukprot:7746148-Lingulodinium_polyedra.AAC.1
MAARLKAMATLLPALAWALDDAKPAALIAGRRRAYGLVKCRAGFDELLDKRAATKKAGLVRGGWKAFIDGSGIPARGDELEERA